MQSQHYIWEKHAILVQGSLSYLLLNSLFFFSSPHKLFGFYQKNNMAVMQCNMSDATDINAVVFKLQSFKL